MRTNYASDDCAASVVFSHNAQNPGDVLKPDKDSYLLFECAAPNKSLHIQLCQDILVDSVALGNFELFSSSFRQIKVYGTDRYAYDTTNWSLLGTFTAQDERTEQLFIIENPHIWASHIRIDFVSYWGDEFYCPINSIGVYGTTMLDQSKTILTPEDEQKDCDNPSVEADPCETSGSPLEQRQCCRPRSEINGGGSVYEVILNRIHNLETQNKKSEASIRSMNATYARETAQLHEELNSAVEQLQQHQKTIALETLLLVIVIGYALLQTLAKFRISENGVSDYVTLSKNSAFLADETLPSSPPLFSPMESASNSAIPSPPPESEMDTIEKNVDLQLAVAKAQILNNDR